MRTNKLTKRLTSSVIFHYHLVSWYKMQIHATPDLQISVLVYTPAKLSKKVYTGTVKMAHINFFLLNTHVTVLHFRINKTTNFYRVK